MYKKVLIATDGSPLSDLAVAHGVELARKLGAAVVFVTASEPFHLLSLEASQLADSQAEFARHMRRRAEQILSHAAALAERAGVRCDQMHIETDYPYEGIIAAARDGGCDLIVMASHGRKGLSAVVLGSETTKVLTHSSIPVLVVREASSDAVLSADTAVRPPVHGTSGA